MQPASALPLDEPGVLGDQLALEQPPLGRVTRGERGERAAFGIELVETLEYLGHGVVGELVLPLLVGHPEVHPGTDLLVVLEEHFRLSGRISGPSLQDIRGVAAFLFFPVADLCGSRDQSLLAFGIDMTVLARIL